MCTGSGAVPAGGGPWPITTAVGFGPKDCRGSGCHSFRSPFPARRSTGDDSLQACQFDPSIRKPIWHTDGTYRPRPPTGSMLCCGERVSGFCWHLHYAARIAMHPAGLSVQPGITTAPLAYRRHVSMSSTNGISLVFRIESVGQKELQCYSLLWSAVHLGRTLCTV